QVIGSSDEILAVELDERAQPLAGGAMRPSALNLAAWAKYNADPYHREYFKTSIKFIADETAASWAAADKIAAGLADKIFFWLRFEPFLFSPRWATMKMLSRAKRFVMGLVPKQK
ncbi:MAG: hypothetical protein PHG97_00780, partial [Candidatus Margulisbacteria bacterium]|nr:hypothetical protein [Candidatus Margulisiibacteriota bacterium]